MIDVITWVPGLFNWFRLLGMINKLLVHIKYKLITIHFILTNRNVSYWHFRYLLAQLFQIISFHFNRLLVVFNKWLPFPWLHE